MPQGKGTYGSQVGRPKKKSLIKKGKKISMAQYRKILKSKSK